MSLWYHSTSDFLPSNHAKITWRPLAVRPVSTPRTPGAALSAPTTFGNPPGAPWPWTWTGSIEAQHSVRATAEAIASCPILCVVMVAPPRHAGWALPRGAALAIGRGVEFGDERPARWND